MTVRILVEAEAELDSAIADYERQSTGLGIMFAAEVAQGLVRIQEYPRAWQLIGPRVRRYRLYRFPYGLVYAPLQSETIVVAIMHLHRNPDYWTERIERS